MANGEFYDPSDYPFTVQDAARMTKNDEVSINISAKGQGLATLDAALSGLLGGIGATGRQMPHERLYMDPAYILKEETDREYANYLLDYEERKALEQSSNPETPDRVESEAERAETPKEAEPTTPERRGLKRVRNLAIVALVAAAGFSAASNASEAGTAAHAVCSPQGTGGIFDVFGNLECYSGSLVAYTTDISNYNPWK